jgi:uncharacterized PurR-regulated membrane protein YhhQ (DUF165 family)
MYFLISKQSRNFLAIAVCMLISLLLLINLSFKIIVVSELMFSASSLLCPLLTWFYLRALKDCTINEQRHVLNIALLALYVFSIGVFITMHLPVGEYMRDNPAYKIVFEELPRKFFATTFAFGLCFYLPHLIIFPRKNTGIISNNKAVLLALLSGLSFFLVNFYFLFTEPDLQYFNRILLDSFLICFSLLLLAKVLFLAFVLKRPGQSKMVSEKSSGFPLFEYLVAFTLIIFLICIACEYRLVMLFNRWLITANSLIFPLALMSSTIISEIFGFRAVLKLVVVLLLGELFFELCLMIAIALPSPDFFNLNPFYTSILPRRIPAGLLSAAVVFLANAWFLARLRKLRTFKNRALRIFFANFLTRIVLCCVSYFSMLAGVLNLDLMMTLAFNAWLYKNLFGLISLPLMVYCCVSLENYLKGEQLNSFKPAQETELAISSRVMTSAE